MRVLIIDGNNLVHRVFWVSKNQPSFNKYFHVYLFLNSIKNYVEQYYPDKVYCAWDERLACNSNAREDMLDTYKGTRDSEKNKEVHAQNELIKKLLTSLGILSVFPEKYEADDVMAILHKHYSDSEKTIVTADKDLCQLIDTKTVVHDPVRKKTYTNSNFENELGVRMEQFLRMKAIKGDKSDNIPGVSGFGEVKTKRVLSGEITLTEEQENRVLENMKLLDLSLTLDVKSEWNYVIEQLNIVPNKNYNLFKEVCELCNFQQIIRNIEGWYNTFFIKDRLQSILNY